MFAATSSFAVPRYDGLWSVSIVTEKGDCDRGYRYPIRISNGQLANAGDTAFTISGKVAPDRRHHRDGERGRQERDRLRAVSPAMPAAATGPAAPAPAPGPPSAAARRRKKI